MGDVLPVLIAAGALAAIVALVVFVRRGGHRRLSRRAVVGTLGGVAAILAMLVGAVSLTRIAGDYLGFPPGLGWTLTGAVDIAGAAGGIMWTAFSGRVRNIGRPMNIVCTLVSGVVVGLDHATHAQGGEVWQWVAFSAGLFIPALAAWILHSLAVITDMAAEPKAVGDRQGAGSQAGDHQAPHRQAGDDQAANREAVITRVGDSQDTAIIARQPTPGDRQAALPAGRQAGDRQATNRQGADHQPGDSRPAHRQAGATKQTATASARVSSHSPTRALVAVPESRREWMTDSLIAAVVAARRDDSTYGRSSVMSDHELTDAKAKALLRYINEHDLMRETA